MVPIGNAVCAANCVVRTFVFYVPIGSQDTPYLWPTVLLLIIACMINRSLLSGTRSLFSCVMQEREEELHMTICSLGRDASSPVWCRRERGKHWPNMCLLYNAILCRSTYKFLNASIVCACPSISIELKNFYKPKYWSLCCNLTHSFFYCYKNMCGNESYQGVALFCATKRLTSDYASPSSGEAYSDSQLTPNFEFWPEIFCVSTCFHMRIPNSCLSVPREKKSP